jgi:hypothetical protein
LTSVEKMQKTILQLQRSRFGNFTIVRIWGDVRNRDQTSGRKHPFIPVQASNWIWDSYCETHSQFLERVQILPA